MTTQTTISIKPNQMLPATKQMTMASVIDLIKDGFSLPQIELIRAEPDKDKRTKLKNMLPMFYPCEYLQPELGAGMYNQINHSGVMIFDLDGLTINEAKKIRDDLMTTNIVKCIKLLFISPSGGLKFGIQTNFHTYATDNMHCNKWHKFAYKQLQAYINKRGIPAAYTDESTCNLNRGVYLSYDPECYYNEDAKTLPLEQWRSEFDAIEQKEKDEQKRALQYRDSGEINTKYASASMEKAFNTIVGTMGSGNRHSKIYAICKCAFERGFDQQDTLHYIMRLKAMGHYTESMTPQAKVRDSWNSWTYSGGYVKREFITVEPAKADTIMTSNMMDIFKKAAT